MSRAASGNVGPQRAFTNTFGVGAGLGAVAYVVNYVLVYLFLVVDEADLGDEGWKAAGQVLYNAMFVATEVTANGQTVTFNLVTGTSSSALLEPFLGGSDVTSTVPSFVYHAAPIVVLLAVGAIAVKQTGSRLQTASAAVTGATVAVGYLVLSALGVFLFETTSEGVLSSSTTAPETMPAILLAGLALPVVLGTIGGLLANEL